MDFNSQMAMNSAEVTYGKNEIQSNSYRREGAMEEEGANDKGRFISQKREEGGRTFVDSVDVGLEDVDEKR